MFNDTILFEYGCNVCRHGGSLVVLEKERYLRNDIVVHYGAYYGNGNETIGGSNGKAKTKSPTDKGG